MKRAILKFFGVAALAAGMMYNVQFSDMEDNSNFSLVALGSVASAQQECLPNKNDCIWHVTIHYGWTGPTISCSTGGSYSCA